MSSNPRNQTTLPPRASVDLPWRRREAYNRAICSFMRPDDPNSVSLADADRFYKTQHGENSTLLWKRPLRCRRGRA